MYVISGIERPSAGIALGFSVLKGSEAIRTASAAAAPNLVRESLAHFLGCVVNDLAAGNAYNKYQTYVAGEIDLAVRAGYSESQEN
jgi:hypothetical protein